MNTNKATTNTQVQKRRRHHQRGAMAEWIAAAYLTVKGYRILARRWSSREGEIDLIAARGNFLVFVEVKQRETQEAAEASVSSRQRNRIRGAAQLWRSHHPKYHNHEVRFDLVFIVNGHWPHHIENGL